MPISIKTRKAKGRALQNEVKEALLNYSASLNYTFIKDQDPSDIRSATMGMTSEDIPMSRRARLKWPLVIECAHWEIFPKAIWTKYHQHHAFTERLQLNFPLRLIKTTIIKRARSEPLAILSLEDLFYLVSQSRDVLQDGS